MAKRKKKHQKERILEPLVRPGEPIRDPIKVPANSYASPHLALAVSVCGKDQDLGDMLSMREAKEMNKERVLL
jgi:hypothetical protein